VKVYIKKDKNIFMKYVNKSFFYKLTFIARWVAMAKAKWFKATGVRTT